MFAKPVVWIILMLSVTALVVGGVWYSVDPKETFLQKVRATAATGPHPFATLQQFGGRFDSCAKVVGIQGNFEFRGVVCCNTSGACNLDWETQGSYLGK